MTLLLDTHIALWAITGDATLGGDVLDRLRHDPDIFLSPVSLWEITLKQATGKLAGPADLTERVRDMGFRELPVTQAHAIAAARLPPHHRDPFEPDADRTGIHRRLHAGVPRRLDRAVRRGHPQG
jgi:PIN domain nuclease of toxin-antitoxin system